MDLVRTHGGLTVSNWLSGGVRYAIATGVDAWSGGRKAASIGGTLERVATNNEMPSVRDAFVALFHPRVASDVIERTLAAPALSSVWRRGILKRLHAAGQ